MRKTNKMMGIAGLALAIGLVLAACPTSTSNTSSSGTTPGQPGGGTTVYTGTIENYSGDGDIYADLGGYISEDLNYHKYIFKIGTVSGGNFSFDLKNIPKNVIDLKLTSAGVDPSSFFENIVNTVTVSDKNARSGGSCSLLVRMGPDWGVPLRFEDANTEYSNNGYSYRWSSLWYYDRAVTIKGTLNYTSTGWSSNQPDRFPVYHYNTYDLAMQSGWNMVYIEDKETTHEDGNGYFTSIDNTHNYRSTPLPGYAWFIHENIWESLPQE